MCVEGPSEEVVLSICLLSHSLPCTQVHAGVGLYYRHTRQEQLLRVVACVDRVSLTSPCLVIHYADVDSLHCLWMWSLSLVQQD